MWPNMPYGIHNNSHEVNKQQSQRVLLSLVDSRDSKAHILNDAVTNGVSILIIIEIDIAEHPKTATFTYAADSNIWL